MAGGRLIGKGVPGADTCVNGRECSCLSSYQDEMLFLSGALFLHTYSCFCLEQMGSNNTISEFITSHPPDGIPLLTISYEPNGSPAFRICHNKNTVRIQSISIQLVFVVSVLTTPSSLRVISV